MGRPGTGSGARSVWPLPTGLHLQRETRTKQVTTKKHKTTTKGHRKIQRGQTTAAMRQQTLKDSEKEQNKNMASHKKQTTKTQK